MSEPYDPVPVDNAPRTGPANTLWTLVLRDPRTAELRRVPVFARSLDEARAQLGRERRNSEMLIRVDKGGTLSQAWSE